MKAGIEEELKKNASRQNVNPFYREDTGFALLTSARRNATSDSDLLVHGQAVTENGAEYLYGKLNEDVMSFIITEASRG